ncbi:MAG: MBL fold metallo-hydrolase [Pseudomonadota bacterium]
MTKADTMRLLRPAPNVLGFYDGRIDGLRLHGPQPNWLDDGGFTLGTCSYAIVSGAEALVYDTHMSLDHARWIRSALEAEGVREIRVILSHHHLDHIAGNAVFEDCEIIANAATAAAMEAGLDDARTTDPPIDPVVMPTTVCDRETVVTVGGVQVALMSFDIHSHDGLCLWLLDSRTLFAGDTLEDTCTYVAEPGRLEIHLQDLARMAELDIAAILPNHGAEARIAAGGYGSGLIGATEAYIRRLLACRDDPVLAATPLKDVVAEECAAGDVIYHPAYETVHTRNVEAVLSTQSGRQEAGR